MKQKLVPGQKIICLNRKASFNYFFLELLEAGIVLRGSEVKSLRDGKGSIADSYAVDNNGEMFLVNSHIPLYRQSSLREARTGRHTQRRTPRAPRTALRPTPP